MKSYILIDRSGSMSSNWAETIGAVNAYVETLASTKAGKKTEVTIAVFDNTDPFEIIRHDVKAADWKPIAVSEVSPRGMTPLYDAIGRLNNLITSINPKKASIVFVTDGAENASREFNRETSKKLLDNLREKKYDVVFIGADFDAFGQSASVGGNFSSTLNMTKGNYEIAFKSMANRTMAYDTHGAQAVANFFSDEIRSGAAGVTK